MFVSWEMKLDNGERKEIVGQWMERVRETVSSLTDVRPEEIVNRNRPWEL